MSKAMVFWRNRANVLQAAVAAALLVPVWWAHAPVLASSSAETSAPSAQAALQEAPSVHLRLNYRTMNIGSDGVQREASYTKIMYRVGQRIWLEKDQPQALRDSMAHGHGGVSTGGSHAGHAHTLAQDAPIMVQRSDTGDVDVQVIINAMERLISVEPAHQGNVGYNGSWEATYWVIPPSSLNALQAVGKPRDGIQLYRKFADESMTEVAWDIEKQYPRRVLKRGPHDTTFYQLTAEEIDAPAVMPWTLLSHYQTGDYSDLLD